MKILVESQVLRVKTLTIKIKIVTFKLSIKIIHLEKQNYLLKESTQLIETIHYYEIRFNRKKNTCE